MSAWPKTWITTRNLVWRTLRNKVKCHRGIHSTLWCHHLVLQRYSNHLLGWWWKYTLRVKVRRFKLVSSKWSKSKPKMQRFTNYTWRWKRDRKRLMILTSNCSKCLRLSRCQSQKPSKSWDLTIKYSWTSSLSIKRQRKALNRLLLTTNKWRWSTLTCWLKIRIRRLRFRTWYRQSLIMR
jgi:hypothetical protein